MQASVVQAGVVQASAVQASVACECRAGMWCRADMVHASVVQCGAGICAAWYAVVRCL